MWAGDRLVSKTVTDSQGGMAETRDFLTCRPTRSGLRTGRQMEKAVPVNRS